VPTLWSFSRYAEEVTSKRYPQNRHFLAASRTCSAQSGLPTIQVPTLVLHSIDNPAEPVEQARYIAERINGSTLVDFRSTTTC
jgi:hypothetical protein